MWIEERNGKFRACERYTDYYTGKQKRISISIEKNTAATRRLAAEQLNKMIEAATCKEIKKEYTLKELVQQYCAYQKENVKASTYERNCGFCNSLLKILGEDVLLDRLNAKYIKEKFLATKKAPGTLNEYRIRLKALLNWGYENDYVKDVSFMKKFKKFEDISHRKKIEDKFLESEEVKLLIEGMDEERWKLLTEFLVLSGVRFGEAAALTIKDIDIEKRTIYIRHNYDSHHKLVTSPKTETSYRDVYMQDELLDTVKRIKHFMKVERFALGYDNPNKLFFQSKNGDYIQFPTYAKYLRTHSEKIIGRRITPHTLRHTHASLLLEKGISIEAISRRLGHHDSKITKDIYLHITSKLKEKDNESIRNLQII